MVRNTIDQKIAIKMFNESQFVGNAAESAAFGRLMQILHYISLFSGFKGLFRTILVLLVSKTSLARFFCFAVLLLQLLQIT